MATMPVVPLVAPPKLIATDLDGTLLRSDGTLSDRTRAALAAAEQAGMRVVLVTGRPPRSVPELLATIGPHFVIAANGAAVYAPDGSLAHMSPIRPLAATRLITRVRRALPGAAFAVEYDGELLAVVSRRWLHVRETYGVDIVRDDADPALLIAVAVCVIHLAEKDREDD